MSGQLELNIAFTCGLIGMGIGWKWGLKQIAGFYDTASAVKHIMFGLVIGTIYALISDELVFRDYLFFIRLEQELAIMPFLIAILLSISGSLFVMLILTRKSIFATKSGPTSGWCLGLGIGAMFSARFSYLVLDSEMYGLSMLGFTHILVLVFMLPLFGEDTDSTIIKDPRTAFFASFVPGGGQIYNGKLLKGLTVLGLEVLALQSWQDNSKIYSDYDSGDYPLQKHRYLEKRNKYAWWIIFLYFYLS